MTVQVTTLPSGLRVATDEMDGVETVALGAWVGVGTRDEPEELNGVAHLLEHMAFKGTERRSARDISEEIEAVGGHLNAYTTREHTAYYAKVLKNDVGLAVDILADILQHSVFDDEELTRERAVIIQEIGQANDTPDDIVFDYFQEAAFPGQPIGRPVLGTAEVIAATPRDAIAAYMREHYLPSQIVMAAAGRIGHERHVSLIAEAFDSLPNGETHAAARARYGGGERREERDLEQVHLVLGFPGIAYGDPDYYAQGVFSTLLGGGMSSRLFQEVREKRGLAYSIYSFVSSYTDSGVFGIYAGTGEKEAEELLAVVCEEMMKVVGTLGEEELERARAQGRAAVWMAQESTSARCDKLGHHMLAYGRAIPPQETVARIDAVDAPAIARVAGRLLSGRPSFAALGPLGAVEPYGRLAARLG
jgi:predicted Zn-dependent peptidase